MCQLRRADMSSVIRHFISRKSALLIDVTTIFFPAQQIGTRFALERPDVFLSDTIGVAHGFRHHSTRIDRYACAPHERSARGTDRSFQLARAVSAQPSFAAP